MEGESFVSRERWIPHMDISLQVYFFNEYFYTNDGFAFSLPERMVSTWLQ